MQHVKQNLDQVASKLEQQTKTAATGRTTSDKQGHRDINPDKVNSFYQRLESIYINEFYLKFSEPEKLKQSKREWARFISALTDQQIDNGFYKLRLALSNNNQQYQYLELHKILSLMNADEKLPNTNEAYVLACNKSWVHPVVYHAAKDVGVYELLSNTRNQMYKLFAEAYSTAVTEWQSGRHRPIPTAQRLERTEPPALTKKQNKARLDELKKLL